MSLFPDLYPEPEPEVTSEPVVVAEPVKKTTIISRRKRLKAEDKPGTRLVSKNCFPVTKVIDGQTRFLGQIDAVNRIYQRSGDIRWATTYDRSFMAFDYSSEWCKIRSEVKIIEHLDLSSPDKEDFICYRVSLDDAKTYGHKGEYRNKISWLVPLANFEKIGKENE
jgi:hypothetical protein